MPKGVEHSQEMPSVGCQALGEGRSDRVLDAAHRRLIEPVNQTILFPFQVVPVPDFHPKLWRVAKEAREQQGCLRRNGPLTVDDRVDPSSIQDDRLGQAVLGDFEGPRNSSFRIPPG